MSPSIANDLGLEQIANVPLTVGDEEGARLTSQADASALIVGPVSECGSLFAAIPMLVVDFHDYWLNGVIGRDLLVDLWWSAKFMPAPARAAAS